ncbi:unnamed protein product [Lampetra fluviatilis]
MRAVGDRGPRSRQPRASASFHRAVERPSLQGHDRVAMDVTEPWAAEDGRLRRCHRGSDGHPRPDVHMGGQESGAVTVLHRSCDKGQVGEDVSGRRRPSTAGSLALNADERMTPSEPGLVNSEPRLVRMLTEDCSGVPAAARASTVKRRPGRMAQRKGGHARARPHGATLANNPRRTRPPSDAGSRGREEDWGETGPGRALAREDLGVAIPAAATNARPGRATRTAHAEQLPGSPRAPDRENGTILRHLHYGGRDND